MILNACEAASGLVEGLASVTVAMDESIPNESAIKFSRGFYDALAAERSFDFAYREGITAVKMSGGETNSIKLITK